MYLILNIALTIGVIILHNSIDNSLLLWILPLVLFAYSLYKANYSTARIVMCLNLFIITLCGDTNYMLYYFALDFAVIISILVLRRGRILLHRNGSLCWFVLLIVGIIAGAYAVDETSQHVGILIYALIAIFFFASENLNHIEKCDTTYITYSIVCANIGILLLFFLNNSFSGLLTIQRALIRLLGEEGIRSNTLGGIITVFFVYILFAKRVVSELSESNNLIKTVFRLLRLIAIVGDIVVLLLLQSRGCYVSLAAVFLIYTVRNIRNVRNLTKTDALKVVLCVSAIICLLFIPETQSLIENNILARFFNNSDLSNGRIPLYIAAFNMWKKHPIIGCGLLQFEAYGIENADPHNFILGYLASVGIIGLFSLLVYLWHLLKNTGRGNSYIQIWSLVIICQLIHGLFEPVLTTSLPLSLFAVTCAILTSGKMQDEVMR